MVLNVTTAFSVTSPGCCTSFQSTTLCTVKLIYHLVDCLTNRKNIVPVVLAGDGWTRFVMTATICQMTCREMLSFSGDASVLTDYVITITAAILS